MKTKYCIRPGCDRKATVWKGKLLRGRDSFNSAGFCEEHADTKCPNMFGKKDVYCFETKDMEMVSDGYKSKSSINITEQ